MKFHLQLEGHHKHRCALANASKAVYAQLAKGAFIAAFTSEKLNNDK
jgi:hypothetical protein